jgi:hypothetical protein
MQLQVVERLTEVEIESGMRLYDKMALLHGANTALP